MPSELTVDWNVSAVSSTVLMVTFRRIRVHSAQRRHALGHSTQSTGSAALRRRAGEESARTGPDGRESRSSHGPQGRVRATPVGGRRVAALGCPRHHRGMVSRRTFLSGTAAIATGLNVPWGIVFLPGGDALVAQRDEGSIVRVSPEGHVTPVGDVKGSVGAPGGEGGLLGLALDPDDADVLYAYVTTGPDDRVV